MAQTITRMDLWQVLQELVLDVLLELCLVLGTYYVLSPIGFPVAMLGDDHNNQASTARIEQESQKIIAAVIIGSVPSQLR
jgi:hypothetical protein